MKNTFLSAILLMTLALPSYAHAYDENIQVIDLQSAITDLALKIGYKAQNTLSTPVYHRSHVTSAYIPLNESLSTRMSLGYTPESLANKQDQWSSTISLKFTRPLSYKNTDPHPIEGRSLRH